MEDQEALDLQREFAERQHSGIGSTDTAKILGLSKYGTALTVWDAKVHDPSIDDSRSLPAWLGMQLQSTVAELYRVATGNRVRAANGHYRHKQDEWLVCHLDYKVAGQPDVIVECKTRAYMKGWGEDGSTGIPPDVWAQVQHQMLVTGAIMTHVAVLFGHHTFRVYPVPADTEFHSALRGALKHFWHDNVLAGVAPEPTGHPLDGTYLGKHREPEDGTYLTATPTQAAMVKELVDELNNAKLLELRIAGIQNKIKATLGNATGLYTPYGTVKWATTKDRVYTDWEQVAAMLHDFLGLQEFYDKTVTDNTMTKSGIVRFTFSPVDSALASVRMERP